MEFIKAFLIVYGVMSIIFTTFFLINLFRNIRRELDIVEGVKAAAQTLKIVYVEYDNIDSMYRMYDKTNNQFLFQAKDELELWKIAKANFPDKTVMTLPSEKEVKNI